MNPVCVVHNSLNIVGGGERLSLSVIESLKDSGYRVRLITTEPTNWDHVRRMTGKDIRPDVEETVFPFRVKYFGIYARLLTFLKLLRKKGKCLLTINTHGDVLPISTDIVYMHYPTFTLLEDQAVNIKYKESMFWRTYFLPYKFIQERLTGKLEGSVILTNSEYSREAIRRHIGVDATVVYPPVDLKAFLPLSENDERQDVVVSCGRYSPEKNQLLLLKLAKELPDYGFIVIGASSGKVSGAYYNRLLDERRRMGLTNIVFHRDLPRRDQLEIYSRSKVYVHPMIGEHFGIAVVEAMASGLIPIVHKSGGTWSDIVRGGLYGYGFQDLDEAVKAVEEAFMNYESIRDRVVNRAREFDEECFKEKFISIVEEVLNNRQR